MSSTKRALLVGVRPVWAATVTAHWKVVVLPSRKLARGAKDFATLLLFGPLLGAYALYLAVNEGLSFSIFVGLALVGLIVVISIKVKVMDPLAAFIMKATRTLLVKAEGDPLGSAFILMLVVVNVLVPMPSVSSPAGLIVALIQTVMVLVALVAARIWYRLGLRKEEMSTLACWHKVMRFAVLLPDIWFVIDSAAPTNSEYSLAERVGGLFRRLIGSGPALSLPFFVKKNGVLIGRFLVAHTIGKNWPDFEKNIDAIKTNMPEGLVHDIKFEIDRDVPQRGWLTVIFQVPTPPEGVYVTDVELDRPPTFDEASANFDRMLDESEGTREGRNGTPDGSTNVVDFAKRHGASERHCGTGEWRCENAAA